MTEMSANLAPGNESASSEEEKSARKRAGSEALAQLLGTVVMLMNSTAAHRHLFIADLEWLILPPLSKRQLKLFHVNGRPMGFVTWAFVNEEAEKRLLSPAARMSPLDWNSGDRLWIVDLVAPANLHKEIIAELRRGPLKGKELRMRRLRPDGDLVTELYESDLPSVPLDS